MINDVNVRKYCSEDISNIENYEEAKNDTMMWECHHRAEILPCGNYSYRNLIDFNLYYDRPASELIFLRQDVHRSTHGKARAGILNFFYGKTHTTEAKVKMSEAKKGRKQSKETIEKRTKHLTGNQWNVGKHWYSNGVVSIQAFSCPVGFHRGRK